MSHSSNSVAERSLFSLCWPIFIDLFLHFSTLLINTFMVLRVSESSVAAMAAGNQIFDLCITIFSFISVGCSVVIAQYLGARQTKDTVKVIQISIGINFILGFIFAISLFFMGDYSLTVLNTPEELKAEAFVYLHILGICLIPEAVSLILAATLRVYGKAKEAMFVSLIVNILTIIGNMLVLYGYFGLPKLGLWGVAYSTLFARIICVILLAIILRYTLRVSLDFRGFFVWQKKLISKVLHIGLPAAGENLVWILQYMATFAFIGLLGKESLASQAIYFQISLFVMLFGIAVSIANEIQVGYLVGEKRFDEAYRRTFKNLKLGLIVTIFVAIALWLWGEHLVSFISKGKNDDIVRQILPLLVLSLFLEPARTINIVMVNALRASGDARFPLYTGIIFMWGVSIPVGYFLGIYLGYGLVGIWIGYFCDELLRGLANGWRWYSRRWEAKRLDIESDS